MLARLRRQFVLISMALTGIVLVGVLGSTLFTTWTTQREIINESLEHALNDDMDKLPQAYAYRALCAHDLGLKEEYIKHLKDAVEKDAASAKSLLSTLFPEDMEPKEYVEYASENPL